MDVKSYIKETKARIEPVLLSYFSGMEDSVREMMEHPIKAGGKRVRPALLLLACEAVGGDSDKALPAAASIELLHTFTLVHDDIMDHDLERRGKPTVHALWGEEMGIIVGDALYSIAFNSMVDLSNKELSDKVVLKCVQELVKANYELHEGQILDMAYSKRETISESEYIDMIGKKTGVLLEASLRIGGLVGGASIKQVDALGNFGRYIGLAFQVKDDILELTADEKELGKPVGSDICEGKKSLPILHALENASKEDKAKLLELLGISSECDLNEAMRILNDAKSIEYARNKLKELHEKANSELDVIEDSDSKKLLLDLANFIVDRKF